MRPIYQQGAAQRDSQRPENPYAIESRWKHVIYWPQLKAGVSRTDNRARLRAGKTTLYISVAVEGGRQPENRAPAESRRKRYILGVVEKRASAGKPHAFESRRKKKTKYIGVGAARRSARMRAEETLGIYIYIYIGRS